MPLPQPRQHPFRPRYAPPDRGAGREIREKGAHRHHRQRALPGARRRSGRFAGSRRARLGALQRHPSQPVGLHGGRGCSGGRDNGCDMVIGSAAAASWTQARASPSPITTTRRSSNTSTGANRAGRPCHPAHRHHGGDGQRGQLDRRVHRHGPCEKGIRPARPVSQGKHRRSGAHDHALQQGHRGARLRRAGPRHRVVPLRPAPIRSASCIRVRQSSG